MLLVECGGPGGGRCGWRWWEGEEEGKEEGGKLGEGASRRWAL